MSDVKAYKCDVCGTIYLEDARQFGSRSTINISFGETDNHNCIDQPMDSGNIQFRLDDVCSSCRFKLLDAIEAIIENKEKNK